MQSFIQFRKLGLAVRKQIDRDHGKANILSNQHDHTLEKIEHGPPHEASGTLDTETFATNIITGSEEQTGSLSTARTRQSMRTALGHTLTGIHVRERTTLEGGSGKVFVVGWEGENDPSNPRNWSTTSRVFTTLIVGSVGFVVGAAASADTAILPQASADFGVSNVVETLTLGLYLVGYCFGTVFAGPFSETLGRNVVYLSTMIIFMIFVMASALAPNIGAQLAFRFLAGVFGATPLTCAGGSVSDMWPSLGKTFAFPIFAIPGFAGPFLGPVMTSYVVNLGSWRWAEWIILIIAAIVSSLIFFFQPETFAPLLLKWKAEHLRRETGDDRFRAELEITHTSLSARLKVALTRPLLFAFEPIVLCMTLYLTVLYIILFTFLDGYSYIFEDVYRTSQGLANVIFTAMCIGLLFACLLVPWVYKKTKESFEKNTFVPEIRLWFAMLGAPAIPISLFWMAWTDYASVSIWSPIAASVLFGYGLICIFMAAYMYIIDSYEVYAASALTFVTFTRYMIAGGMTVAGGPFYKNVGTHWTLTILGCISLLMTPIPYVFYRYGYKIRLKSKYAVSF